MKEQHTAVNINASPLQLNQDVSQWSKTDVLEWLKQNGFNELRVCICYIKILNLAVNLVLLTFGKRNGFNFIIIVNYSIKY